MDENYINKKKDQGEKNEIFLYNFFESLQISEPKTKT